MIEDEYFIDFLFFFDLLNFLPLCIRATLLKNSYFT